MALQPQSYGDIITIDGDFPGRLGKNYFMSPANYQVEILDQLRFIETKTQSGKALFRGLSSLKGKSCRIIPVPYSDPGKTITTPVATNACLVEYNPWTWNWEDRFLGFDPTNRGYDPDDVLFHELVHVFLQLAQIFRSVPRNDQYHNREDFYAVLFTNIYVSEQNKSLAARFSKLLRGDHNLTFSSLAAGEPDVAAADDPALGFYKKYKSDIDDLFHTDNPTMTRLANDLAAVSCAFNPLHARPKSEYIPLDNPFGGWTPK